MKENNIYYVYEWIRLDTNEPFYVGKGKGNRWCELKRNEKFNEISSSVECAVYKLKENLSEENAFKIEKAYIEYYRSIGLELCNIAYGGAGGIYLYGEDNPMYGRAWYDENTSKDKIESWKEKIRSHNVGNKNPMYGISPRERMDEETYNKWIEHKRESCLGKNNPNYGNNTLKKKIENNPELRIQYYSRKGGQNGKAKKTTIFDKAHNIVKEFGCMKECSEWLLEKGYEKGKPRTIQGRIKRSSDSKKEYLGFYFEVK